jgi:hypothetical protein
MVRTGADTPLGLSKIGRPLSTVKRLFASTPSVRQAPPPVHGLARQFEDEGGVSSEAVLSARRFDRLAVRAVGELAKVFLISGGLHLGIQDEC